MIIESNYSSTGSINRVAVLGVHQSHSFFDLKSVEKQRQPDREKVTSNLIDSTNKRVFSDKINEKKHPLAQYLGIWKGDDLDDLLSLVYKTRSKF